MAKFDMKLHSQNPPTNKASIHLSIPLIRLLIHPLPVYPSLHSFPLHHPLALPIHPFIYSSTTHPSIYSRTQVEAQQLYYKFMKNETLIDPLSDDVSPIQSYECDGVVFGNGGVDEDGGDDGMALLLHYTTLHYTTTKI